VNQRRPQPTEQSGPQTGTGTSVARYGRGLAR